MFRARFLPFLIMGLSIAMAGVFTIPAMTADFPMITKEELKSILANHDVLVLDVRSAKQWEASGRKIKGAVWEDPKNVESWADKYTTDKTLVLYCA